MDEKFRNISLGVAALIVAVAFAVPKIWASNNNNRLEKARTDCLREGDNATNFQSAGYQICMRYKGFDEQLRR